MSQQNKLESLSEHLFRYRDTCNAYVLKKGKRALIIDCGTGEVHKRLKTEAGIEAVDWLLFTHHHRDQSQGADALASKGAKVAVPEYERYLFENAARYMGERWVYDSYNDRGTANTRITDLPVNESLLDYEVFSWRGYEFEIVPTPGHTLGSSTLLAQIDGATVAFTGDLLREDGRFHSLHDLEYGYGGCEGANLAAYSALRLQQQSLDLICPSHGEVIDDPDDALSNLFDNARSWHRWKTGHDLPCTHRPVQISDHLVAFPFSVCSWYAIVSDDGHALLVDHGTHDSVHFTSNQAYREWWETQRYVAHGIDELRKRFGVESIDVVIPTHYHDDHVAGIHHLQRHHGTQVWCVEQLKGVLERPQDYAEMCLFPKPVQVNRTLGDGEEFEWHGFQGQVWHFPGQTEYHQLLMLTVDGKQVLFTGDSVIRNATGVDSPVIFRNYHRFESHEECTRKLVGLRPNLIAPGHGEVWAPLADELASFKRHTQQLQTLYRHLLPEDQRWQGINPFWVRITPYQIDVKRGKKAKLTVRVENFGDEPAQAKVAMAGARQTTFDPPEREARIGAGATKEFRFELSISQRYRGLPRVAIAADLEMDGERYGQVAEAFVKVEM